MVNGNLFENLVNNSKTAPEGTYEGIDVRSFLNSKPDPGNAVTDNSGVYKQFHSQELIEPEPEENNGSGYVEAGNILIKKKECEEKYERALRFYDKALEINPRNTDALFCKALALEDWSSRLGKEGKTEEASERLEEAFELYDETTELDPEYASAWNNKGVILEETGEITEAIKCYDKALRIEPDDAVFVENRNEAFKELGENYQLFEVE